MKDTKVTKSFSLNDKIYDEFLKRKDEIKFEVDIHFEYITNSVTKEKIILVSAWYPNKLYGNTYRLRDKEIFVGYVDDLKDKVIEIGSKNVVDILIKDIIENH